MDSASAPELCLVCGRGILPLEGRISVYDSTPRPLEPGLNGVVSGRLVRAHLVCATTLIARRPAPAPTDRLGV